MDFPKTDSSLSKMVKISVKSQTCRIGVMPISGFALMAYASTVEPFRAANGLSRRQLYEVVNIGATKGSIESSGAASVNPQVTIKQSIDVDYLFIVAGGNPFDFKNQSIFNWLGRISRFGTKLGGVSAGPAILATAGLMNDRRMTVHWEHAEALSESLPNLTIERTLYVIDRDRLTCGGGTAALDLMLELIMQHHGTRFANLVSDWFLHTEIRPSINPQRSGIAARVGSSNAAILDAVKLMENHIADPCNLSDLADASGISKRQINRLFKQKLGRSTMGYYRDMRLDKARNFLINSGLSLTEIAFATGFANSSHFSRLFKNYFGRPPSSFR